MAQIPSPPANSGPASEPDPSMDDILASIRRILNDDEKTAKAPGDGVLMLDPAMIVDEEQGPSRMVDERVELEQSVASTASELLQSSHIDDHRVQPEIERPVLATSDETVNSDLVTHDARVPTPISVARDAPAATALSLVAPAAAAAAATSVDALMRTLAAERSAAVSRGLVTIEDLVREEIRPLLKAWLDNHLPPLVERLVQAEIERVVGRHAG